MSGRFMIYHGITSFLRVGDVSFVDLKTRRVHALGELKTHKIGEKEYRIGLHLVAETQTLIPRPDDWMIRQKLDKEEEEEEDPTPPAPMRAAQKERLNRQVKRMGEAIEEAQPKAGLLSQGHQGDFYFDELSDVIARSRPDRFEFVQAGPAMLIGALRCPGGRAFGADLKLSTKDVTPLLEDVPSMAIGIVCPDRRDNSIVIEMPGAGEMLLLGGEAVPFAWWPLDDKLLHDVLFGEVMLVTVHNDAHLRQAIEDRGFEPEKGRPDCFQKRGPDGRIQKLEHMDYFYRLAQGAFMSLNTILAMIDDSLELAASHPTGSVRIRMSPMMSLRTPATETE